jgi:hypothetical protein
MADCILWTGRMHAAGYGVDRVPSSGWRAKDGRDVLAHRLAWERANGPIPEGLQVHHRCENRRCINVEHMELLGVREHAGASGHGKLTQADADEIRRLRQEGHRGTEVAEAFGVSVQQVCHIFKGRCWA